MNILSFLHLCCAVAYLYLAGFITLKNPRSPFNRVTALLFTCLGIWSISCMIMHNPLSHRESVLLFDRIGSVGSFMMSSIFLIFAIIFTEQKRLVKHPYAYGFLLLVPVVLLIKKFEGTMVSGYVLKPYGWTRVVNFSPETYALFAYYILTGLAAIYFIARYALHQHDAFKRRQAIIIGTTFTLSFVLGSITDALLPALNIYTVPELANIFSIIWTGGITYTIIRYRLLPVTPQMAADEIISTMAESLMLLDTNGTIITVNRAAADLLGYAADDLIGRPATKIVTGNGEIQSVIEELRTRKHIRNRECVFKTRDGQLIPMLISASGLAQKHHLQGIVLIAYDITDRKGVEEKLKQSLREKEILLSEIHHRVKNNLMIVSSLLDLQSSHTHSRHARETLKESQSRIKSMQLIHQKMHQSETMTDIDSTDYIENLVKDLFHTYCIDASRIRLRTSIDHIPMGFRTAIPCGIIINELMSNAFKHAFLPNQQGAIEVTLKHENKQVTLSVRDDGIGITAPLDLATTKSLGLTLVLRMVQQLDGTISTTGEGGACFKITFPFSVDNEKKSHG